MRGKKKENLDRKVTIRFSQQEFDRLHKKFENTHYRQLSEYLRKLLKGEPVTVYYRNKSADEFLSDMLRLKKELNAIGNNFNQAVNKLHILEKIPEFRTWILINEATKNEFMKKVDEIRKKMALLYDILVHENHLQKGEKEPQK